MLPLNGSRPPLTQHSLSVLARLDEDGTMPAYQINPGVINRLLREQFIEVVVRGGKPQVDITEAGRSVVARQVI